MEIDIIDVIQTEEYGDIDIGTWENFNDDTVIYDVDC